MLSKRERVIVIVTSVVLGILGLDWYVIDPLMEARSKLSAQRETLTRQVIANNNLFAEEMRAMRRWKEMTATGLSGNPGEAESLLLQSVRDWAQASGVNLAAIKPERVLDRGELREVTVGASATGSMKSMVRFMHSIESAAMPVRVRRLLLDHRSDKGDEMSLEVQVSTLYRSADAVKGRS